MGTSSNIDWHIGEIPEIVYYFDRHLLSYSKRWECSSDQNRQGPSPPWISILAGK